MTFKIYEIDDEVIVDFEDVGREHCEVFDFSFDGNGTRDGYLVRSPDGVKTWVSPATILCLAEDYDGTLAEDIEFEVPMTLTDILQQMREDSLKRLREAESSVEFETQLQSDLEDALEAIS